LTIREEFIAGKVFEIVQETNSLHIQVRASHPEDDVRVTLTGSSGNILHCYLLHLEMVISTLCQPNWWKNVCGKPEPDANDKNRMYNLDQISKFLYFVHFYSQIEWNYRIILQAVKPATSKITLLDNWKNIYSCLFKITSLEKYANLFDIARLVRNAIHNNGYYLDQKQGDISIEWAGHKYHFENGKQINFATHENILLICRELSKSMSALIDSDEMKANPYIKNEFHLDNPHKD